MYIPLKVSEIPPSLQEFVEGDETRNAAHAMQNTQHDLESLGRHYAEQHALIKNQSDQLRQEEEQLRREIVQLRTGDRDVSYEAAAPEATRLRRLLRAELGLGPDDVIFLCTALEVPDGSWQDAVEGVLGRSRFDLLVPPEHYDAAMRLYRQRRHNS